MKDKKMREKFIALDLFAGCGGMTYGLQQAGFTVHGALELNSLASETYRLNHPRTSLKQADIREVNPSAWMKELAIAPGELNLLAGCPPCQGFSRLRTLNGTRSNRDQRNRLLLTMAEFVQVFKPKAVMMENVPALGGKSVFKDFLKQLRSQGYVVSWQVLDASEYGVPQRRKRLVLVAGLGFPVEFGEKEGTKRTVRTAIGHLKPAGLSGDPLHDMPEKRSPLMQEWIAAVPLDGGSRRDLPEEMQRPCHRRSDGFKDVYGRMAWDRPAPTITGGCFNPSKGRFLHPEQNRNITMREAALLQTFPESFRVPPGTTKTAVALMIGNALPPAFVEHHAIQVKSAIGEYELRESPS